MTLSALLVVLRATCAWPRSKNEKGYSVDPTPGMAVALLAGGYNGVRRLARTTVFPGRAWNFLLGACPLGLGVFFVFWFFLLRQNDRFKPEQFL